MFILVCLACQKQMDSVKIKADICDDPIEVDGNDFQVSLSFDRMLDETKWQFVGIVDTKTGDMIELIRQDDSNYCLSFDEFNQIRGFSTTNEFTGYYHINYEDNSIFINCNGLSEAEMTDGDLYLNALNKVQFFCLHENELRLFFNDNKNYLLFYDCDCWERTCNNRYDIKLNEYILMQIIPDVVSSNSINKWIVENHTQTEMNYGEGFYLDYFDVDENKWIKISPKFPVHLIGYILYPGKTAELTYTAQPFYSFSDLYSLVQEFNEGKKGKYRISKRYTIPSIGNYCLSAEFEII